MRQVCDCLIARSGEILVEWNALAVARPWHEIPGTHRLDSLPQVITGPVEAATRASLADYHRSEYQKAGKWPESLDDPVDQSPLLTDR